MEQIVLNAELRTKCGKGASHQLRVKGKIPAVFYGKGEENLHIVIDPAELEKVVAGKMGMNTLIQLKIADKGDYSVILRDYQADAIKRNFIHADLATVDLTKKIQIAVPIKLIGRPAGAKEGGILEQVTRELKVLCLPTNIPSTIDVDISGLNIGQNLHLEDIKLPEGVEPQERVNVTIASVFVPKEEEEAPVPGTLEEPEVLTAKKEEGEEEGEAPAEGEKPKGAAPAKEDKKAEEKKSAEKK